MVLELPNDFKEFLRLLNSHQVSYLLVGGFAVGFHGYPRATSDIDVWVEISEPNATKLVAAIDEFGFSEVTVDLFLQPEKIIRMGVPPMRIEILTTISGVDFDACYPNRLDETMDGVPVPIISLEDLKKNKLASGRHKDLNDLEQLE